MLHPRRTPRKGEIPGSDPVAGSNNRSLRKENKIQFSTARSLIH